MASPIEQAIRQIVEEKGLAYESVIDAIQSALAAAYRKDFGDKNNNIEASFDPATGEINVWDIKTVVEDMDLEAIEQAEVERRERAEALANEIDTARKAGKDLPAISIDEEMGPRFNPKTDIMFSDAQVLKSGSKIGEIIRTDLPQPDEFGRMAAMTAKQVITQKLREAEREVVFNEFKEHEGELINATVQRREGRSVLLDLGKVTGIMRPEDQIQSERYNTGDRIKVYVRQVSLTSKGPEIILSRTADEIVQKLFEIEIPEVLDGLVEIKGIAREAGSRAKVAVASDDDNIDPIGACIGQRGARIQTIISELGGEKVDIIEYNDNPEVFISNSLSPAKVDEVEINEEEKTAIVKVDGDQLSLAIGKGGQNVRLAAKLIGWKINISEINSEESDVQEDDSVDGDVSESDGDENVAESDTKNVAEEVSDGSVESDSSEPQEEVVVPKISSTEDVVENGSEEDAVSDESVEEESETDTQEENKENKE